MDWVLIFSIQWVVSGTPTAPTTWTNVNYESEELCQVAADKIITEMSKPLGEAQTFVRAVCVLRKK